MEQSFPGFNSESFAFFRELAQNNSKPWFDQNRERYERHVQGAFRGLLASLEPFLLKLNPHFETGGKTNGNFSRINRDIRFSKDKSPYKQNYYLYVFDGRRDRGHAGRLYVGLAAECRRSDSPSTRPTSGGRKAPSMRFSASASRLTAKCSIDCSRRSCAEGATRPTGTAWKSVTGRSIRACRGATRIGRRSRRGSSAESLSRTRGVSPAR